MLGIDWNDILGTTSR